MLWNALPSWQAWKSAFAAFCGWSATALSVLWNALPSWQDLTAVPGMLWNVIPSGQDLYDRLVKELSLLWGSIPSFGDLLQGLFSTLVSWPVMAVSMLCNSIPSLSDMKQMMLTVFLYDMLCLGALLLLYLLLLLTVADIVLIIVVVTVTFAGCTGGLGNGKKEAKLVTFRIELLAIPCVVS